MPALMLAIYDLLTVSESLRLVAPGPNCFDLLTFASLSVSATLSNSVEYTPAPSWKCITPCSGLELVGMLVISEGAAILAVMSRSVELIRRGKDCYILQQWKIS